MSRKTMPGFGKSAISRMCPRRPAVIRGASLLPATDDLPQVADEQQVLEVRRDGGEVLERLQRLGPARLVARAQGRGQDRLQQVGFAVGGCAEHAQVAAGDAV